MAERRRNDSSIKDLMGLQEKLAVSFEIIELVAKLDVIQALHDQTDDPKLKKFHLKEATKVRKKLDKLGDKLLRLQGDS